MYPELLNHIKKYVQLTESEEQLLCERLVFKKVKKKKFLLEPGKLCPGNYFVVKGCVRQFFVNHKLKEQIIQFGIENWWIADHDSLLNRQPSSCYLQTVEPSELLLLP